MDLHFLHIEFNFEYFVPLVKKFSYTSIEFLFRYVKVESEEVTVTKYIIDFSIGNSLEHYICFILIQNVVILVVFSFVSLLALLEKISRI